MGSTMGHFHMPPCSACGQSAPAARAVHKPQVFSLLKRLAAAQHQPHKIVRPSWYNKYAGVSHKMTAMQRMSAMQHKHSLLAGGRTTPRWYHAGMHPGRGVAAMAGMGMAGVGMAVAGRMTHTIDNVLHINPYARSERRVGAMMGFGTGPGGTNGKPSLAGRIAGHALHRFVAGPQGRPSVMDQVHAIQHRQSVLAGVQHAHGMPGIAQSVLGIGAPGHPVQNKYGKKYVSPQAGFNMGLKGLMDMGKPGAHWTPPPPQTKAQKAKQYAANVKQAKANSAKAAKNRKWVASHGGQFTKAAGSSGVNHRQHQAAANYEAQGKKHAKKHTKHKASNSYDGR